MVGGLKGIVNVKHPRVVTEEDCIIVFGEHALTNTCKGSVCRLESKSRKQEQKQG